MMPLVPAPFNHVWSTSAQCTAVCNFQLWPISPMTKMMITSRVKGCQRGLFFCKVVPAAVDFNGCCQRPIVQAVERQLKPLPFIGLDSYAPLHPPTPTSPQTPTQTLSTPPPPQSQPVRVSGDTTPLNPVMTMVIWNEHPRNEWVFEEEPSSVEQRKALKTFRAAHSWLQRKNALQCTIVQILICTAVHCQAYFHCAQIKTHCSVLYTLEIDQSAHCSHSPQLSKMCKLATASGCIS